MSLDLQLLGSKLKKYRDQFKATPEETAAQTGISKDILAEYEAGIREPTGDHILILADFFKCDYKFFLSNEKLAAFEQTDTLFRKHGDELSKADRWAIQEFLFLCECEEHLLGVIPAIQRSKFTFHKKGDYFKRHGADAAAALRQFLGYSADRVGADVFADFRKIGLHVFRRALVNSDISGLFVRHPFAGRCVLVNYSEDVYRQRFTAAHEAAHAILDDSDVVLSFVSHRSGDLSEIRANTFASRFLMPPDFLRAIPNPKDWSPEKTVHWASKLKVSTAAFVNALSEQRLLEKTVADRLKPAAVPFDQKQDVELPQNLSVASRARKAELLARGLSDFYVRLCFDAYEQAQISAGRLAEMLLIPMGDLPSLALLYGRRLEYGD